MKDQESNPRPHTPRPAALPVKVEQWVSRASRTSAEWFCLPLRVEQGTDNVNTHQGMPHALHMDPPVTNDLDLIHIQFARILVIDTPSMNLLCKRVQYNHCLTTPHTPASLCTLSLPMAPYLSCQCSPIHARLAVQGACGGRPATKKISPPRPTSFPHIVLSLPVDMHSPCQSSGNLASTFDTLLQSSLVFTCELMPCFLPIVPPLAALHAE